MTPTTAAMVAAIRGSGKVRQSHLPVPEDPRTRPSRDASVDSHARHPARGAR
jgi:hypothetical protein